MSLHCFEWQDTRRQTIRNAALKRLSAESELAPALEISADGTTVQVHGYFSSFRGEPVAATVRFLAEYRSILRCPARESQLSAPEVLEEPNRGMRIVRRFHDRGGVALYGCGVETTFDPAGILRSVRWRLPRIQRRSKTAKLDASAAIRLLRESLSLDNLPEPHLELFDSSAIFGSPGGAEPVWVSSIGGERPVDVLVSSDGAKILHVITRGSDGAFGPVPQYHVNEVTGVPDFITFGPGGLLLPEATSNSAVTVALALFSGYPRLFGTGKVGVQLNVRDVTVDTSGMSHVILQQVHGGIPVWGCELRVHLFPSLAIRSVNGNYMRDPGVSIQPAVDQEPAQRLAIQAYQAGRSEELEGPFWRLRYNQVHVVNGGLVILPLSLSRFRDRRNYLAWRFQFEDADRFVSAATGEIVYTASRISEGHRQIYDGKGLSVSRSLQDGVLDIQDGVDQVPAAELDQDARPVDAAGAAVEAFWRLFSWNGYDNHGSNTLLYVNAGSFDTINGVSSFHGSLAWKQSEGLAVFPRGFAEDDWIGHELTHGVVQFSARLEVEGESDALNEHLADVFANLIFPRAGGNWRMGEFTPLGGFLRDLLNPELGNPPCVGKYSNYMAPTGNSRFSHENAGIGSRAAVLLCDGDGAPQHPGIGRQRLARLYWNVMTTRLHPWATYFDEVASVWETSRDLAALGATGVMFPGGMTPAPVFDEVGVQEALWAFRQVELDLRLSAGWFQVPGLSAWSLVFFAGESLPAGELVTDVEVIMERRSDIDGTQIFRTSALASAGGTASDSSNTVTITITSNNIGTSDKEVRVTVISISSLPVEVSARVSTGAAAPLPTTPFTSGVMVRWDFFGGRHDDVINGGMTVQGTGCLITDIVLELLDQDYRVVGRHRMGEPDAVYGHTGASITSQFLNSTIEFVMVHSWHDTGAVARYQIVYYVTGANCSL